MKGPGTQSQEPAQRPCEQLPKGTLFSGRRFCSSCFWVLLTLWVTLARVSCSYGDSFSVWVGGGILQVPSSKNFLSWSEPGQFLQD